MKIPKHEDIIDLASLNVMLCAVCKKAIACIRNSGRGVHLGLRPRFFSYVPRQDVWTGSHHTENNSFVSSVSNRCYICYPVLQACPRQVREHAVYFRTFFEIEDSGSNRYSMRVTIELRQLNPSVEAQVIELHGSFKILPKSDLSHLDLDRHLPTGTFNFTCQKQVYDWLDTCCESHSTCNEDWRTTSDFHMRLLKVSPELGDQVILEEFQPSDVHPPYATLSHCWDTLNAANFMYLTAANLSQLKCGFAMEKLSQKFRDAVLIARWMKVHYLWVDALCIMQGSPDDWQQQSKVMGDIYAGSLCNIAATNGGVNSSCFRERPVETVEPFCIPNPRLSSLDETHVIGYDDLWCNSLLDAKLHTRAWVLQERLLAPRTVHFGKEQIYWECRISKACEAYPDGIPAQFSNHRTKAWREGEQIFNPKNTTMEHGHPEDTPALSSDLTLESYTKQVDIPSADAYGFWSRTVEQYMGCDMTYASDKLVAIAGLARKMQELTNELYLAGLWRNKSLPQSLLWFVPASKQTDGRRSIRYPTLGESGYRAPSWSWASIDGSITWIWPGVCDQVLIQITDAVAQAVGNDPVGAVKSAALCVRGELIPVRLDIMHRHEDGTLNEDGTYGLRLRRENTVPYYNAENGYQAPPMEPLVYLDTNLSPISGVDAYILPVCTQWRGRKGRVIAAVAGLLVRKIVFRETVVYERFGLVGFDEEEAAQLRFTGLPTSGRLSAEPLNTATDFVLV